MALKSTVEELRSLLLEISHDLEKSLRGNRAASQRVRTLTIRFGKVAKVYRKESIAEGRKGKSAKKAATRKPAGKKTAARKKTAKKTARRKSAAARKRK